MLAVILETLLMAFIIGNIGELLLNDLQMATGPLIEGQG